MAQNLTRLPKLGTWKDILENKNYVSFLESLEVVDIGYSPAEDPTHSVAASCIENKCVRGYSFEKLSSKNRLTLRRGIYDLIESIEVQALPAEDVKGISLFSREALPKDPDARKAYEEGSEVGDKGWLYNENKIVYSYVAIDKVSGTSVYKPAHPIPMGALPFTHLSIEVEFGNQLFSVHRVKVNFLRLPNALFLKLQEIGFYN